VSELKQGTTVICDRYAYSGVSFSASKGLSYDWCISPDVGLPAPDLVLFLDISPEVAKVRGGYGEERYEKEEMQTRVRTIFKRLGQDTTAMRGQWVEVDAGKDIDSVRASIWKEVLAIVESKTGEVKNMWADRVKPEQMAG